MGGLICCAKNKFNILVRTRLRRQPFLPLLIQIWLQFTDWKLIARICIYNIHNIRLIIRIDGYFSDLEQTRYDRHNCRGFSAKAAAMRISKFAKNHSFHLYNHTNIFSSFVMLLLTFMIVLYRPLSQLRCEYNCDARRKYQIYIERRRRRRRRCSITRNNFSESVESYIYILGFQWYCIAHTQQTMRQINDYHRRIT